MDGCLDRYQVKPTHKQTEGRREEKRRGESKVKQSQSQNEDRLKSKGSK